MSWAENMPGSWGVKTKFPKKRGFCDSRAGPCGPGWVVSLPSRVVFRVFNSSFISFVIRHFLAEFREYPTQIFHNRLHLRHGFIGEDSRFREVGAGLGVVVLEP